MSTALFIWELGGGLGHIAPMVPLATALSRAGHEVYVALRELTSAAAMLGKAGVCFVQAPYFPARPCRFPRTVNLAHILGNNGWGDDLHLFGIASAWRTLYRFIQPDVVVFDHSPTAMLAARGAPFRRVVTGLGFFCPPDAFPLPLIIQESVDRNRLENDERAILARVNRTLARWTRPPLQRLGQLYGDVDDTFLQTFAELDHYPDRLPGTHYYGPVHGPGGIPPIWPDGDGPRVYAYLKDFPALPELLSALIERNCRTIVFADGVSPETRRRFASPLLRFENQRLDLSRVGAECDLAIHNANHGTLCQLLLSGRPMLQLPITLEQKVLARAVDRLGASETAPARGDGAGGAIRAKLDALLSDAKYAEAAARFAAKYASFNPAAQVDRMAGRVEELMGGPKAPAAAPRAAVFAG